MDTATDVAQFEQHRRALTGQCYRMLGSWAEADDAVQETMLRAWRAAARFDGRSSLRTWLYRIATNVCLDALSRRATRRERPMETGGPGRIDDALEQRDRIHWLEPIADARALPEGADPAEQLVLRQSIRLAFVAALQLLPPKQRAALLLTEVLGWSAAEVAETLSSSVASVNSALQRARATLAAQAPGADGDLLQAQRALPPAKRELCDRFVAAFERYDIPALASLLTDDAVLSMPPYTLWLRGRDTLVAWWHSPAPSCCRGSRLVPVAASDAPAWAQYRDGGKTPWALVVLETDASGERISGFNSFLDVQTLFPRFGLPLSLL